MSEVTLAEWSEGMLRRLRAFCDEWNRYRETDSESFPEKMSLGDWDEQFDISETAKEKP